jgi:hypothetical protein
VCSSGLALGGFWGFTELNKWLSTGEEVLIFNLPKFGVAIAAGVNHID